MGNQTPLNIALGVFAGNIAYLFIIFLLSMFFSITPIGLLTGDFSGFIDTFISVLRAIGGLFVIADLIIVSDFILSMSDSSW
jgi:hypothetical protein